MKRFSKKWIARSILTLILLSIPVFCFSGDQEPVVARIGKHKVLRSELIEVLNQQASNPEYRPDSAGIKQQLDMLIEKKVLIREAVNHGLALRKSFLKTIQSFWEQTLILELIKLKSAELEESVSVSDEEIKAACKLEGLDLGISTCPSGRDPETERHVQRLRKKKKEEALGQWIKELTRTSEIKIYHEVLDGIVREKHEE